METRNKYLNLGYGQGLLFCHCCRCFCSSGCHVQGWIISWWTPVMDEKVFSSLGHFNRCSAIYKPKSSLLNHSLTSLLNTLPAYRNIWNWMTNIRENLPNNIREPHSLSFYLHKFDIAFGLCKNKNRQINIVLAINISDWQRSVMSSWDGSLTLMEFNPQPTPPYPLVSVIWKDFCRGVCPPPSTTAKSKCVRYGGALIVASSLLQPSVVPLGYVGNSIYFIPLPNLAKRSMLHVHQSLVHDRSHPLIDTISARCGCVIN